MSDLPKVCFIIPFYNGDRFIKACVISILDNSYPNIEIYIVNNSSEPTNIYDILKSFESIKIIDTQPRMGFGRAGNAGLEYAIKGSADYTIFLNQDTILDPLCIRNLIKPFAKDFRLAITSPISFTYDFGTIEEHFVRWFIIQCPGLLSDLLQNNLQSYYLMQEVSGACLVIKNEFLKKMNSVPLFDPLFFMYMEDIDLCRRLRFLGLNIALVPTAKIAHAHSHTTHEAKKRNDIHKQHKRSNGIFLLKNPYHSFIFNVRNFIAASAVDYFYNLTKLRFLKIFTYLCIDIGTLISLKTIFESRSKDRKLLKQFKIEVDSNPS